MLFFVTPATVTGTARLNLRRVGGQMLGRGLRVIPRRFPVRRVFWRIVFDQAPMRYCIALSPFPVAMLIRPDLALAISQAPLLMFAIVFLIESSVLSVQGPDKRRRLIPEPEAQRALDMLRQRGTDALSRVAAGRGMQDERLHLIVEQSGLARVPPLTLISVQVEGDRPGGPPVLLDLTEDERRTIRERLFDADLDEARLHIVNLWENRFLRDIPFEARAVTAHGRLMAMAGRRAPA